MVEDPLGSCLDEDELLALADGSISSEARLNADRHLDACDDCRRVVAALAHAEDVDDDGTPTVPAQRLDVTLPGEFANRYVLLRQMAENSLYIAYVARDTAVDELVGLKWIRQEWAARPDVGARLRATLLRARAIASDNVVRPRECHEADGALLLVEDLVASDDLAGLLRARGIGPDLARDVVMQFLGALSSAHGVGTPHGHLRTENVLIDLAGHVHVADFGLADALHGNVRTHAELCLDDTQTASRLALTLLERCGGGAPALTAILESAIERPDGFPSVVELAAAVHRVQLEHRLPVDRKSAGRDRDWMPTTGAMIANKYRVEGLLGRGGMGAVVTAREAGSDRPVAIKLMPPRATRSRAAVERFLREGRAASAVSSEHVVRVLEVGQSDEGAPFIVMEHLEGATLGRVLKQRGALPIKEALHYVLQTCAAVAECHAMGIVHRDLKPDNIMVLGEPGRDAMVKVLDFGVSKSDWLEQAARVRLTGTADVLGTPTHMSPEQVRSSKSVDARTDIWALGVILYEALTGSPPFIADNLPALCAAIVSDDPRPPRELRPDLPRGLEAVILHCLDKHPDARPFSVRSLAEMLAPFAGEGGLVALDKVRAIAEASVPRISSIPPPPRLTPIPPPSVTFASADAPAPDRARPSDESLVNITDTASFRREVSTRRRAVGVFAALVVGFSALMIFLIATDDEGAVPEGPSLAPSATGRRPAPAEIADLPEEDPTPTLAPKSTHDAGAAPRRRRRPPGNPLDTRF
ncbi:MAG: protein kinase [Myxococcales bacterium]|nr:protein kinase [Myxococcales bacterium]